MPATVARLEAILSANTRDFDRAMDKSDSKMRKAGKAAGVMGLALGGVLVAGLSKSVKEAMEAEKSQARLEQAFSKSVKGGLTPYRGAIEAASKAAVKLGFDDEDLTDSLGSLIIATGNYKKAQDASNVAMDLARFKGVSLEASTKMLTMAMAGSQRATKQLGISVQPVTDNYDKLKATMGKHIDDQEKAALAAAKLIDKQATSALVIDTVSAKVRGQAQAYSETAAGGMEVFRVQLEEMQENLGKALLPALNRVLEKLVVFGNWMQEHPRVVKLVTIAIGALAAALVAASAAQLALNLAVLANPYVAATVALLAFVAAVVLLWRRSEDARKVIALISVYILGFPAAILLAVAAFGRLSGAISAVGGAFKTALGWIKAVVDKLKWIIDNVGKVGGALGRIPGVGGGGGAESSSHGLIPMVQNAVGFAREMGWRGQVTSGFRTYEEQAALYARYLAGGPLAARPGTSSHEKGQAVDVTDYGTFGRMMSRLPEGLRLYNRLGSRDPVHFSVTGYARGGIVPGPLGMPQLAMVHGGETITPPGEMTINLYADGHKLFSWVLDAEAKHRRRNG